MVLFLFLCTRFLWTEITLYLKVLYLFFGLFRLKIKFNEVITKNSNDVKFLIEVFVG